jgi:putative glycosyltransferase (TIGR04348 family)
VHREKDTLVIVTPALADANNGNWRTAARWARFLGKAYRVRLTKEWNPADDGDVALMIALHARRSAASIVKWRAERGEGAPLLVALTGTDLYRDIDDSAVAQRSLALADRLIVLNELGPQRLPAEHRAKCEVVLQSCTARATLPKSPRHQRSLMVGHLRDEKDPATYWRAVRRLAGRADLRFDHIGAGLDEALAAEARALQAAGARFRWLGALAHPATREHIQRAHLLVHASVMEGGAQAVIEAVRSGTPVLASRMDGNVGLLGADYGGYFPVGDDAALATLLTRCRDDADMLAALSSQVAARTPLFAPEAEATALARIVADLLGRTKTLHEEA